MCNAITDWYDCRARIRQERRKGVRGDMGHDRHETTSERGTQSHSADLTLEQERVSRAQYDLHDTYAWRIYKQYERYNAQTGYA